MATMFPLLKTIPDSPSLGKLLLGVTPTPKFVNAGSSLLSMHAAKTIDFGLGKTVGAQLARRSPAVSLLSAAAKELSLVDTAASRFAGTNVLNGAIASLGQKITESFRFGEVASPRIAKLAGRRLVKSGAFGVAAGTKHLSLIAPGVTRLSGRDSSLDFFAKTVRSLAGSSPSSVLAFSATKRPPLMNSIWASGVAPLGGMHSVQDLLGMRDHRFKIFGEELSSWRRSFVPGGLLEPLRSITRLIERLGAPIVWLARQALDAYEDDDHQPMLEFLHVQLRIRPATEDHCQALALALFLREWEAQVDLHDPAAVRAALRECAWDGVKLEVDHQVAGRKIGYLPEGIDFRAPDPGPDVLAMAAVVPWAENFDNRDARYAARRLKSAEQQVAQAWTEDRSLNWRQAPQLVGQDIAVGERVRGKLRRLGNEITSRAEAARTRGEC
ncbi:hypothetical protein [Streptomyces sp. NPDC048200]|uniref:hypothetical protein n=1 Tax=Streptomyces sp. NPDC048200 TaxID=3365512 RepID=UPI00371E5977